MKTLKFHGYSDDTFGEYGVTNQDFDNCASGKRIVFLVKAAGEDAPDDVMVAHVPGLEE